MNLSYYMMFIYIVKMLLMKANNHGFYLPKNCYSLLVFRINLDFLNFTNSQKLVKNCYMKNM